MKISDSAFAGHSKPLLAPQKSLVGSGMGKQMRQLHASDRIANHLDEVHLSPGNSLDLDLGSKILEQKTREKIQAMFEEHGIDLSAHENEDMSVEATAQRIFDFSTGMLDTFRKQNEGLEEADLLKKFETTIRGAVEKGFGEAIEILEGMNLHEDILETSRATFDTVWKLFDDYFQKSTRSSEESAASDPRNTTKTPPSSTPRVDLVA